VAPEVRVTVDGWSASTGYVPDVDPDTGCVWVLSEIDGWHGGLDVRGAPVDRPMSDGVYDGPAPFGGRTVTLTGSVVAPDRGALRVALDRVAAVLAGRVRSGPLTVDESGAGGLVRWAGVRLAGPTLAKRIGPTAAEFSVALFAADPLRYASVESSLTLSRFVAGNGRTYPLRFPRLYGSSSNAGAGYVFNAGNADTYPVVTFSGPLSNPSVSLDDGRILKVINSLGAGEQLVVDMGARTVFAGSSSRRRYVTADSTLFEIAEGRPAGVRVQFNADSGNGTMTMRYRAAWS
jgi:hypothetical protein